MYGTEALIYLAVLIGAFYLLIIRPQARNAKRVKELLSSLKVGDHIVTVGGMHAEIVDLTDDMVTLKAADGVALVYDRGAVARKRDDEQGARDGDVAGKT